jgi:hypothetical protein
MQEKGVWLRGALRVGKMGRVKVGKRGLGVRVNGVVKGNGLRVGEKEEV